MSAVDRGLGFNPYYHDLPDATFDMVCIEGGWRFVSRAGWPTDGTIAAIAHGGEVVYQIVIGRAGTLVARFPDGVVEAEIRGSQRKATVRAGSFSAASADRLLDRARTWLPRPGSDRGDGVDVTFWYDTDNGPSSTRRTIEVPTWSMIEANYEADTRARLARMMTGFRPSHGGQIVLWHGEPGTGKTWALRALVREWRDWCSAHYVVDPDKLFGTDPAYLMEMLLSDDDEETVYIRAGDDLDGEPLVEGEKWRLLIMEDTGELITPDAREKTGQALSRLLNVADGFIGQGLRVLVLITTNEVVEKMYPAIGRAGRAASVIEFHDMSADEAATWQRDHGLRPMHRAGPIRLSDLYAAAEEFEDRPRESAPAGFRFP